MGTVVVVVAGTVVAVAVAGTGTVPSVAIMAKIPIPG